MAALRIKATLRISSALYTVAEIGQMLNAGPSSSANIGESISKQNPKSEIHNYTHWNLKAPINESQPLPEHILWIVEFLEIREATLIELQKGCIIDVFCFYSQADNQGGFSLPSELCLRLGKLKVDVTFDIYC